MNIKTAKMKLMTTLLWLLAFASTLAMGNAKLADRLVLEVNTTSYTQRQFQLYIALKNALQSPAGKEVVFVGANNWADTLEAFRQDMIVEQEAQRLGSTQANRRMVDAAYEIINSHVAANPALKKFLESMQAGQSTVRRVLASVIRVKGFLLSKDRQQTEDVSNFKASMQIDRTSDWFLRLEQRFPYRIYEGARQFKPIVPSEAG